MQILRQGAEAILYLDEFEGEKVLVKERIKKDYRIDQIDNKLRKERTREEVKLMTEARKIGVLTPKIFHVDYEKFKIIMEFIDGKRVKEFFSEAGEEEIEKISFEIGKLIGKLHSSGIIHGDLTTSNMILKDNQIDLNLLFEALKATHFKILKACWENIVKGYKKEYKYSEQVLKKVEEIEARARYFERKAKG
jgi:tRNA A-37 threonylcarbamoyl transferase component Bud32